MRNWSGKKMAIAVVAFVVVALAAREVAGWARELFISFHGGGHGP